MNIVAWVKVGGRKRSWGWQHSGTAAYKSKPSTKANEVAVRVEIEIPDAYFEVPEFRAKIGLPPKGANPILIDATVAEKIGEAISKELGFKVHLSSGDGAA